MQRKKRLQNFRSAGELEAPLKRCRRYSNVESTQFTTNIYPDKDMSNLDSLPSTSTTDLAAEQSNSGYSSDGQLKRPMNSNAVKKNSVVSTENSKRSKKSRRSNKNFLLGGSVTDPLNLKSLKPSDFCDEVTSVIEVIVPKNAHDPLNLMGMPNLKEKKKKRGSIAEDIIVSPVVPQKHLSDKSHKSKKQFNLRKESNFFSMDNYQDTVSHSSTAQNKKEEAVVKKDDNIAGVRANKSKQKNMLMRYRFGNFNNYRKPVSGDQTFQMDPRIDIFCEDWFLDKNVLDVGCNAGLFTISIATTFRPKKIVGVDLDHHLIAAARTNVRFLCDQTSKLTGKFPTSFGLNFGPVSAPSTSTGNSPNFPDNIIFRCENYVLPNESQLEKVQEGCYDCLMAISVVKWVHLNWGDDGLKRFFKRAFREIKNGGRFILETENLDAYKRCRNKMTEEMKGHFEAMRLFPEDIVGYLLSSDVGFSHHEYLDTLLAKAKGWFGRIHVFYKGEFYKQDW